MTDFNRRRLLGTVAALPMSALLLPGIAKAGQPVDVVKVLSFSCSFCYASEAQDTVIESATLATGGKFVKAPVPSVSEDNGAMQRIYYASRDMGADFSKQVLASLYKGCQEQQVPLFEFVQVYTWLLQDLPQHEGKFTELFKKAQGDEGLHALQRAINLAMNGGVQSLPTYILLAQGQISAVLDMSSGDGKNMGALRTAVLEKLKALSA